MKRLVSLSAFVVASLVVVRAHADETEVSFAYVPAPAAESLIVDQPLGRLVLRGWDKPEVRIVATKRARSSATLDRLKVNVEMRDGRIRVRTGVRVGDVFRSLPPSQSDAPDRAPDHAIDLTIDAPRGVQLQAATWAGDIDARGFRAGAELASRGGEVRASDIDGKVRSSALSGRQRLSAIRGDVEADGVSGDVDLDTVSGAVAEARVVEGTVTAREVSAHVVRLFSTSGGVVLVGTLRPGARYELTSLDGDVQLRLAPAPFSLSARGQKIHSAFALRGEVTPTRAVADHLGGGPQLELTAAQGGISLVPLAP